MDLTQDLRFGWRTLARAPGFTIAAALTLAFGIGANTAIFSIVDGVMLRPLPFADADRLTSLWPDAGFARGNFDLLEQRAQSWDALAGVGFGASHSVTGDREPVRVHGSRATAGLFPLLGVQPVIGRTFRPDEGDPGAEPVVLLSWGFWQSRFAADPAIVGAAITVDGTPRTVIGVLPRDFRLYDGNVDLWLPAPREPGNLNTYWSGPGSLQVIGRLRPGVTTEQATRELRALAPDMRDNYPWDMPTDFGADATVVTLRDRIVGEASSLFVVLLAAVGLVLLIACANVANLVMVRAVGRSREIAVRAALGAGRRRIARQLLTENVMLAGIGGAGGLVLALIGVPLLAQLLPPGTPRADAIAIDPRVLVFVLGITALTALLFGLAPALRVARTDLAASLRDGTRGGSPGRAASGASNALVVAEIALAVVLVTAAGLVIRSFASLLAVDTGFRADNVTAAAVAPPTFRYNDADARRNFFGELTTRIEALPGVRAATVASTFPFGERAYGSVFLIEGRTIPQGGDWPVVDIRAVVDHDFLDDLGIPILDGRGFTPADRVGTEPVVVIGERAARQYWPDESPIGRRISFPGGQTWTIIGVAADVKWTGLADDDATALFLPSAQADIGPDAFVLVRAAAGSDAVAGSLRSVVASIDDATPVSDIRTLGARIADSAAVPRFASALLAVFAALALLLGAIGTYGVVAYAVGRRVRELGIRMALGADTTHIRLLVLRQGLILGGAGVALGLAASLVAARALRSLLFGVGPADPLTFTATPLLLLAITLLAAWIPARRATLVAPASAFRAD